MADLAFGLSKTAIELLADRFNKAIKEDAEQWQTVERDLVFITGEFEMMQSFLDTATEEHVKNKIVATWVRQVRNLSFDVEDCIDFVVQTLDTPKRSSWRLRMLPSCGMTGAPLPVDVAVAKTTLLRARVVDVSQRNIRYNLITDSASKPMATMDLVSVQKTAASSFDVLINAVKKSSLFDLAELITREEEDSHLHVVSICGTEGDLVKVAMVRKMYSDSRINKVFQCRAWVKLVHPFNPHEFLRSLMTQFFTHSCQQQEEVVEGLDALARMQATQGDLDLINEFTQKIKTHKYLIVLEDLGTMVQWDAIRSYLPDRKKGSLIVVLTHHSVVASQCTGEPCRVSELGQFSSGHSVRVYYKEGFHHDRDPSLKNLELYHSSDMYGLLGRDRELVQLFEQVQKNHESRLVSVWGMPGVGKSALVKTLCNNLTTSDEYKSHVLVNVSHPFNPMEFCRSFLENLDGKYANVSQVEDPIKVCRYHLHKFVRLFVIDGVKSNEEWDWMRSNLIQHGGSIMCTIIITSEESVAKHCALSIDGVYNVKGLHSAAANALFEKVFEVSAPYPVQWMEQGFKTSARQAADLVLSMCGGLPKVITTVAGYLARKPKEVLEREMRRLSDNFMEELMSNPEFDTLRDIPAWLHSYLHACPRHLKKYILYLSIFPQDVTVRRRRLIRRWIAEGYSKGIDGNSMEKYAEKIFDEVAALSIMQPVLLEATSKVIGYQVNGIFRDYIMSRPVEETILFPVEVSALEKRGHGCLTTEGIGQHLAIGSTWDRDHILFESLDFSRLRSLTLFDLAFWSFFVSDRMRVLRVLDLENAIMDHEEIDMAKLARMAYNDDQIRTDEDQISTLIGKLPSRLKFLSLRGPYKISRLPDAVAGLLQLQTLDIRDTSIVALPPFITKLRKLQYIRAGNIVAWTHDAEEEPTPPSSSRSRTLASFLKCACGPVVGSSSGGVVVPRGIKRLEALHTLGAVFVNTADGKAILDEIVSLRQLKKLEIFGISQKHGRCFSFNLCRRNHLESLTLQFDKNNYFLGIPTSLRSLKMFGHVEQLPPNIKRAVNLEKLTLEMSHALLTAEAIEELGCLPSLRTLRLRVRKDQQHGELQFRSACCQVAEFAAGYQFAATRVDMDQNGKHQFSNKNLFMKLQMLEIACKSKLHVTFDEGAMEKLEQLKFYCLQGSEMQFSGLERPASLKQVWLLGSFDDALTEAVQQQLAKHPKIPALKTELLPRSSKPSESWRFLN